MKRKILCSLIAFLLLFSFSACTGSPGKQTETMQKNSTQPASQDKLVTIKENYWNLACKNTDVILYRNLSGSRGLEFELVSAFPFEADELAVEVESDSNVQYTVSCYQDAQEEEETFPFYIYQCYQGMDWRRMGELVETLRESEGMDTETVQELGKMQDMYYEEYQTALDQGKLPQLYRYIVGIRFDLDNLYSVVRINAITLTLRGETKRYALDNLLLDAEKEFGFENTGISMTIAISDAPIYISNDGTLDLTYFDLQSQEPFTLTGLSFFEEDPTAITDCSVTLTQANGTETEMKWNCITPMQVLAGESVCIHVLCEDSQLAGIMEAVITKYIMVQYLSVDGKECAELVQGIYRMRQGLYDLYAAKDGANVLSYYLDYYSVNPGLIQAG